ncbi:MAG: FAD:protein FMN transferase, partial [Planctomycetes bacterium]|nr:FAD:protein FMN transferase [Planctomycetota bacterium]
MSAARGRMLRRLAALVAITGLVIWSVWRWHRQPRLRQLSGTTMGTYFDLKIVLPAGGGWDDLKMGDLAADIEECLKDVNAKMSTYIPDSELSRFNRHPDASPVKASPELLDVLLLAREISELSGGAFDITVGPIVNAYGFGPVARRDRLPADDELEALRDRVGFRKLVIDEAAGTIAKQRPDIYCDLSAIAKGYGVDRVADLLEERGIADYMVEIGGEVRARGRNQDGRPWRIGVQKPVDDPLGEHLGVQRILELTGAAVATSGDYRNFVLDEGGRRISHSIDPRTGRPVA